MPVSGEGESLSGLSGTFSQGDMAPVHNVHQHSRLYHSAACT